MKKVILKKRLEEGVENAESLQGVEEKGEKQKPTMTMNSKKEETDCDTNQNEDFEMEAAFPEESALIIDETTPENDHDDNMNDDAPMDMTEKCAKGEETRIKRTMFTGVPKTFMTRVTRQIVHSGQTPGKRCRSKRVGYTRAQLHAKKSGQCKKEFRMFMKALEEVDTVVGEVERDFNYIKTRNKSINTKNASTRGRLIIAQAANLTEIGDNVETYDDDNGGGRVRITLAQKIESKLYVVDQGANRTHGKEVLTVYTRDELETEEDDGTAAPSSG